MRNHKLVYMALLRIWMAEQGLNKAQVRRSIPTEGHLKHCLHSLLCFEAAPSMYGRDAPMLIVGTVTYGGVICQSLMEHGSKSIVNEHTSEITPLFNSIIAGVCFS